MGIVDNIKRGAGKLKGYAERYQKYQVEREEKMAISAERRAKLYSSQTREAEARARLETARLNAQRAREAQFSSVFGAAGAMGGSGMMSSPQPVRQRRSAPRRAAPRAQPQYIIVTQPQGQTRAAPRKRRATRRAQPQRNSYADLVRI